MKSIEENNNNELDALTESIISKVQNEAKQQLHKIPTDSLKRGTFRQISMVILANIGIVAAGMGLGFPAISLKQLKDPEGFGFVLSQASWFGIKFETIIWKIFLKETHSSFNKCNFVSPRRTAQRILSR